MHPSHKRSILIADGLLVMKAENQNIQAVLIALFIQLIFQFYQRTGIKKPRTLQASKKILQQGNLFAFNFDLTF